jgi:DNA invertase Pin-like site-specific DNA recombinase
MTTIRELGERNIVLRSLREGIDTSNATERMVAGVPASLAELELELGRERRAAAREARRSRGQHIGRPKALDKSKAPLSRWTRDSRNSTRVFEFCSGLVDLVVCVRRHRGRGHRLALAGERFVRLIAEDVA